jgi:hypothetical protein
VSRLRSSHTLAARSHARSHANFGIEGHWQLYDSSAALNPKFATGLAAVVMRTSGSRQSGRAAERRREFAHNALQTPAGTRRQWSATALIQDNPAHARAVEVFIDKRCGDPGGGPCAPWTGLTRMQSTLPAPATQASDDRREIGTLAPGSPTPLPRRRWLRLLPVIFVTYSFAYVDRANYGFGAAAGMADDLHIDSNALSLLGALGSFLGTYLVGYLNGAAGGNGASYLFMASSLVVATALTLAVRRRTAPAAVISAR